MKSLIIYSNVPRYISTLNNAILINEKRFTIFNSENEILIFKKSNVKEDLLVWDIRNIHVRIFIGHTVFKDSCESIFISLPWHIYSFFSGCNSISSLTVSFMGLVSFVDDMELYLRVLMHKIQDMQCLILQTSKHRL